MSSRTPQLRQSFLLMGAVVALVLVAGFALLSSRSVTRIVERQANERDQDVATHVASLVGMYLRERRREAEALARSPAIVRAALDGSQQAISRRLPQLDTPTLERMFSQRHVLGGDPELAAYLRDYVQRSEFSELFFTESHGYSVLASNRTSDFVQSDENWWRQAVTDGLYEGAPRYDSSVAAVSLEYDVAIRAPRLSAPVGVLKAVFPLDRLSQLLTAADAGAGVRLQVVDAQGMLIVGGGGSGVKPNQADLLHPIPDAAAVPRRERPDTATVPGPSGEDLVVTVPVDNGKWWVVFRQPEGTAYAAARTAAANIVVWTVVLFGATLALLFAFWRRLNKRVTEPVKAAGAIASRVAGGDLSVTVERSGTAEVGDLLTSVHSMVVALRRLVGAIRSAADEAAAMATEISASTEQMSASTEEMSATCQDLTKRAAEQAQLVRAGADDAAKILQIATILAAGAEDSVRRNTAVAEVARRNKDVLDQSTVQLATLAEEVNRGAAEAEALARASADIQKFVTQAKAVATQTNMLALNAAIEAARAGPQGRGFAVVADEVRKLASVAAAAAGDTADTVRGVLARVQATRDRLTQLAQGTGVARDAAQTAAQGLGTVAAEAQASDVWGREIAKMAGEMRVLVEEISARLGSVAQGTETLLASAQEIAASSEEQSASTQEIASSANQLAEAADKLTGAVKSFRLLADEEPPPQQQAAD
ncbi:MAG TPA: methyl-accepting chemotaxis protein [Gemmatimonadales bacterium]|nr:methyl-accepting chemotaxis protein [Gemmatimonadales bacterium]